MIRPNPLRALIKAGKPTLGTRTIIPDARVWESICETGFYDYIEFGAHAMNWNYEMIESFSRTLDLYPDMSAHIKCIPEEREFLAPRAIDAGFQNVKFAACRSAEEVRECIRLIRPELAGGIHGNDPRRVSQVKGNRDEWQQSMMEVGVWIVIERKEAMDDLDEILTIEDVDMISMGKVDYSQSIGKPKDSPEVKKAERECIEKTHQAGKSFRAHIGYFEEAQPYLDLGVKHFFMSQDLRMIVDRCKREGEGMRKLLG